MNFDQLIQQLNFDLFFDALGMQNLDADKKASFKSQIFDLLTQNIKLSLVSLLTEEDSQFISNTEDTEALLNYFTNVKKIDLEVLVIEEASKLREYLVANMAYVQGSLQNQEPPTEG
jgi:hypothetical protein